MKLFKMNAHNKMTMWEIWSEDNVIKILANGVSHEEVVTHGKAGRTLEQQIESRINSRIQNKLDQGFKYTLKEAAESVNTNTLDLFLPMLAQSNPSKLSLLGDQYVQPKLDGMRMLITKSNGEMIAYTRKGKLFAPGVVDHILAELSPHVYEGEFLDGELYEHGVPLQTIMSRAKRAQPESKQLVFHIFDMINDNPFVERANSLHELFLEATPTCSVLVPTWALLEPSKLPDTLANAVQQGYEGLILRDGGAPYHTGKRSNSLVKVKQFYDSEFNVVDLTTGAQGEPVFVCDAGSGKTFRVTVHGSHKHRQEVYAMPELYIGCALTVKYAYLTPQGIPFHPVAIGFK